MSRFLLKISLSWAASVVVLSHTLFPYRPKDATLAMPDFSDSPPEVQRSSPITDFTGVVPPFLPFPGAVRSAPPPGLASAIFFFFGIRPMELPVPVQPPGPPSFHPGAEAASPTPDIVLPPSSPNHAVTVDLFIPHPPAQSPADKAVTSNNTSNNANRKSKPPRHLLCVTRLRPVTLQPPPTASGSRATGGVGTHPEGCQGRSLLQRNRGLQGKYWYDKRRRAVRGWRGSPAGPPERLPPPPNLHRRRHGSQAGFVRPPGLLRPPPTPHRQRHGGEVGFVGPRGHPPSPPTQPPGRLPPPPTPPSGRLPEPPTPPQGHLPPPAAPQPGRLPPAQTQHKPRHGGQVDFVRVIAQVQGAGGQRSEGGQRQNQRQPRRVLLSSSLAPPDQEHNHGQNNSYGHGHSHGHGHSDSPSHDHSDSPSRGNSNGDTHRGQVRTVDVTNLPQTKSHDGSDGNQADVIVAGPPRSSSHSSVQFVNTIKIPPTGAPPGHSKDHNHISQVMSVSSTGQPPTRGVTSVRIGDHAKVHSRRNQSKFVNVTDQPPQPASLSVTDVSGPPLEPAPRSRSQNSGVEGFVDVISLPQDSSHRGRALQASEPPPVSRSHKRSGSYGSLLKLSTTHQSHGRLLKPRPAVRIHGPPLKPPPTPNSHGSLLKPPPTFSSHGPLLKPPPTPSSHGSLLKSPPIPRSHGPLLKPPPTPSSHGPLLKPPPTHRSYGPLLKPPPTPRSHGPLLKLPPIPRNHGPLLKPLPTPSSHGPLLKPPPTPRNHGPLLKPPPTPHRHGPLLRPPPTPGSHDRLPYSPPTTRSRDFTGLPPGVERVNLTKIYGKSGTNCTCTKPSECPHGRGRKANRCGAAWVCCPDELLTYTKCGILEQEPADSQRSGDITTAAPWAATILMKLPSGYVFVCGGALIHERVVLTDSHCIRSLVQDVLVVRLGEGLDHHTSRPMTYQEISVRRKMLRSEDTGMKRQNDVALLFLSSPARLRPGLSTLCVRRGPPPSDQCLLTTYSMFSAVSAPDTRWRPSAACQSALRWIPGGASGPPVCPGLEPTGPIGGDRPGAAVSCPDPRTGKHRLAGLVSWDEPGSGLGVYTRVQPFYKWIDDHVTKYLHYHHQYFSEEQK